MELDEGVGPELSEPPVTEAEGDVVFSAFESCLDLVAPLAEWLARYGALGEDAAGCVAEADVASGILRQALRNPSFDEGGKRWHRREHRRGRTACIPTRSEGGKHSVRQGIHWR